MIPLTPSRAAPNIADFDPLARIFLSRAAYADMLAPPVPFIVERRCGSNYQARLVFQAIQVARMLYGRDDVSYSEIATFAQGISRTRIGEYIGFLCDKALLEVVGHREDTRLKGRNGLNGKRPGVDRTTYRTARYRIDMARLVQESAVAWAELIHNLATGVPAGNPSRREPLAGQLVLELPELIPDEDGPHVPGGTAIASTSPGKSSLFSYGNSTNSRVEQSYPVGNGDGSPTRTAEELACPTEQLQSPYEHSDRSPTSIAEGLAHPEERLPYPYEYGTLHSPLTDDMLYPHKNGGCSATGTASPPREPRLFPQENMVGGWVGESDGEEGGREVTALSLSNVRSVVRTEVGQAIQEALTTLKLPQLAPPPRLSSREEPIPPAPSNEPEIDVGPVGAWEQLLERPVSSGEQGQIREIVRTFTGSSSGTAAYWLVRAMYTVAIEDAEKLTLRYVRGVLKRLARAGHWESEALTLAAGEERRQTGTGTAELEKPPAVTRTRRGKQRDLPALPAELHASQAVQTYQAHAPEGIVLTELWARAIYDQVRNLSVWEGVCLNWRERNDYSAVAKMLDRYGNELAALQGSKPGEARPDPTAFDAQAAQAFIASRRGADEQVAPGAGGEVCAEEGTEGGEVAAEPDAGQQESRPPNWIWNAALDKLRSNIDRTLFQASFIHGRLEQLDDETATISFPLDFQRKDVERHLVLVQRALSNTVGYPIIVRVTTHGRL